MSFVARSLRQHQYIDMKIKIQFSETKCKRFLFFSYIVIAYIPIFIENIEKIDIC